MVHVDPTQIGMDKEEFENSMFQRVYQYLRRNDSDPELLDHFNYKYEEGTVEGDVTHCIQCMLK